MSGDISIIIPCYNQTDLLKRNLGYLEKQSYKNFNILLLDDASTEDYQKLIPQFSNLNISYARNEKNIGAIKNIFNSISYKTNTLYKLSLHEDDILHKDYLKKAKEILNNDKDVIFVATIADWFKTDKELSNKFNKAKNIDNVAILNKVDFIREIIDGKHITFGSIVYRNSYLDEEPDFKQYGVLCDRPFLISLIKDKKVALIKNKAIFVRDHGEKDNRFSTVTEEHCLNLMNFYKKNLPNPNSGDMKKLLFFSTNNLIGAYSGLTNKQMSLYQFIKKGKSLGIINLSYVRLIGLAGLVKLFLGKKVFNIMMRFK